MLYPFESLYGEIWVSLRSFVPDISVMKQTFRAISLTLLLATAAGPAHAASSCRVPGGHVVATDSLAKLVAVPTPDGSALYACIRRSGRKIPLDDAYADARLAGRWVAWQRPTRLGKWRIAVHDLRTGKERLVIGHVAAHSLRLTTRGSIAWAQAIDGSDSTPLYANEVGRRSGRVLDDGDVDAASVRLRGRLLSWVSGGQQYAALLR
jgi:hypothetical protein